MIAAEVREHKAVSLVYVSIQVQFDSCLKMTPFAGAFKGAKFAVMNDETRPRLPIEKLLVQAGRIRPISDQSPHWLRFFSSCAFKLPLPHVLSFESVYTLRCLRQKLYHRRSFRSWLLPQWL
jgi:hypothetical protein